MHLFKTFPALLLALALLPGCGGGEEEDDALYAQDAVTDDVGPPSRGPAWLEPPPEELVVVAE
jgi:hypothetical protein